MGKVAYVDMIGGAAGDMLMAAWVDPIHPPAPSEGCSPAAG